MPRPTTLVPRGPLLAALALPAALGLGCHQASATGDGAVTQAGTCANETRATPYAPGLVVNGMAGRIRADFVSASPAPPIRGNNTWVLDLAAVQGNAASPVLGPLCPAATAVDLGGAARDGGEDAAMSRADGGDEGDAGSAGSPPDASTPRDLASADAGPGCLRINVVPFMPDHGHKSPILVGVTDLGNGRYQLDPVNLFMAGYWEVSVNVIMPSGVADVAVIKVCVDG